MSAEATSPRPASGDAPMPEVEGWTLYVLRCGDGSLYTGITTDLARRVAQHEAGRGARYTRGRRPLSCVARWAYADRASASRAEAAFKRLPRADKLGFVAEPEAWSG